MRKLFTKFFGNDLVFLIMTIIAVVSSIIYLVVYSVADFNILVILLALLVGGCSIVLFVSYKKHDKNVMKGMLGAFLMLCLFYSIIEFYNCESTADYIFTIIYFAFSLAFFVNHFLINSSHLSSPNHVFFSELLCIGCFILDIVWNVYYLIVEQATWGAWEYVLYIADILNLFSILGIIVCVQQKLDLHRIAREENGYVPPQK